MAQDEIVERIADPVARLACGKCGVSFDVANLPMLSPVTCPQCGREQAVPARVSGFLLIEVLGKGGMAAVYRAYDETLGRMVAIKILRSEVQQDAALVKNFIREARAAAQINHRNIVQVYTVGQAKGQAFLVMELLDGGRLDELIAADREVDEIRVLEVAIGVAEGLKCANEIGLIHGDIKPANILFNRAGVPKIADFGLARFKGSATVHGEIWGTPYYIAPETVRKQKEDHRADMYSLGATLYHALGGQPPFDGRTATDVVVARLKEPPLRIDTLRPTLHPVTVEVISRMLETDRIRRHPTYASLIADLQRALDQARTQPILPAGKKGGRKRMWTWVLVILAVAGLLGGVILWAARRPSPPADEIISLIPSVVPDPADPDPASSPPDSEERKVSLQPFSDEEGQRLAESIGGIGERTIRQTEDELVSHIRDMEREHEGRPWYAFWYAFPVWLDGDTAETERRIRALREREFEPPAEGVTAPGLLPQALAHVLAGEPFSPPGQPRPDPVLASDPADEDPAPSESPPPDPPAEEAVPVERVALPAWYLDVADLVVGLRELSLAETRPVGRLRLARYLEAPEHEGVPWATAGKPIARRWLERAEAWEAHQADVAQRIDAGEGDEVIAELQRRSRDPQWGLLKPDIDAVLREARRLKTQRDRRIAAQQRRAAEAALRERVAAERTTIESVQSELLPRVQQLDFRGALALWEARTASIETEEVQADVAAWRVALARMDRMKLFLAQEIRRRPYTQARGELRGDVVQARDAGVTVALSGGVGQTELPWARIGPRVFSDMVTQYLSATAIPEPERGEHAAGLAVFFHVNGAARPAAVAAANAIRWNPETADGLRRIMPEGMPSDGD